MKDRDVGCHLAALCAQAIEKSIKAYVIVNGGTPALGHRADKYLSPLLGRSPLLRYKDHHRKLSGLFDAEVRGSVRALLDMTPGTLGRTDVPNTEYPWTDETGPHCPAGASTFQDRATLRQWLVTACRVSAELHKLGIASDRVSV